MSEQETPTALIVDFGGVLTTNIWTAFDAFCRAEGLDEGAVKRAFRDDPGALADLRELETGKIDEVEFGRRFGARLGVDRTDGLVQRLFSGLGPEPRMVEAVRAAHAAGHPTGLISNSWGGTTYDLVVVDELFDAIVISGEVGLHKPQPEIYLLCAERLGVPPESCVFVDDLRENCRGAEQVGMAAILHRGPDATLSRLEELLGVSVA